MADALIDKAQAAIPIVASRLQTFLALDFGMRRTGFAVGNRLMRTAQPQGTITVHARRFARQLHGRFKLPVFEVDERYTTTEARSDGARDADAAAACIILEQFLRNLPP